jgi:phosphoglycerate kinase
MTTRSVRDAAVTGKRVLVRVDFNVPMVDGVITDDSRIRGALPTIRDLLDRGAAVILVSHLGRPKGKPNEQLSLKPVAARLADLLGTPVPIAPDVAGPAAQVAAGSLQAGHILMLENVRFEPGEEQNDPAFAGRLAAMADLYVDDAFGAAHRAHASTVGVAQRLPAYAGHLMDQELAALRRLNGNPARPYVAVLGGAKVSDKLEIIDALVSRVDTILVGGGIANTFLLAMGNEIGRSLAEQDRPDDIGRLLAAAAARGVTVLLPTDVVVAPALDRSGRVVPADAIPPGEAVYDIGPETARRYAACIGQARSVFWNGPMGVVERPAFAEGTLAVARAIADSEAFSVVGGGDSLAAVALAGVATRISHLSTGGGASLEFIAGRPLPGVVVLELLDGCTHYP